MSDYIFYCDKCKYSTLIKSNLSRHNKSKHACVDQCDDTLQLQVKKKPRAVSKIDVLINLATNMKYEINELTKGVNYLKITIETNLKNNF